MSSFLAALARRRSSLDMTVSFYSHVHAVSYFCYHSEELSTYFYCEELSTLFTTRSFSLFCCDKIFTMSSIKS